MTKIKQEWFQEWFDQEEYHLLYMYRDKTEASHLIDKLINSLRLTKGSKVLDLACGRGRHSHYLHQKGFSTYGIDLSKRSLAYARHYQDAEIRFIHHDMRQPFPVNDFEAVFNFFTSFGYFSSFEEHSNVIGNVAHALKKGGFIILDYLNALPIRNKLRPYETITREDVTFKIKRFIEGNKIIKEITFDRHGQISVYREEVAAFTLNDFMKLFDENGITIRDTYGDYQLNSYDESTSDRLILIGQK